MACGGRVVHVDRYPGSFFSITVWEDVHQCERCREVTSSSVTLPDVPWAQTKPNPSSSGGSITSIFEGVRHPNFPDDPEDEDGLFIGHDHDYDYDPEGGGCPECGAGSGGDPYGQCVCPPE